MKKLMKTIAETLMRFAQSKACMLMLLAVLAAFVFPDLAQAAPPEEPEDVEKTIASLLSIGVDFLNALLWPFLLLIGDLMDTDMILGPGMEEKLKDIWIPVRDLVNIGFVLVLLVVAFYNVLGIGGGEGDLAIKTALPKIVLGLVLVNFTFIGGKVVLDLVNVATTAAFALPELAHGDETPYDFSGVKEEFQKNVCYKGLEADGTPIPWDENVDGEEDNIPIYTRLFCTKADDGTYNELDSLLAAQYFTDLNSNNIGLVMAVNMGGLSSLSVLKAESIDSFSDLTVSIMFALVMYLVFATSYLVLGIVLLVRIIVLWIALALSPLAVLVYVVPQIKEWAGGGGDFSQKIIKTLLAPVIIGLTMSLGYIMIDAWDGNLALDGGGFKANEVISKEFLIEGMDDLPQFIIALASIMIVWTGVFAAASDTYASFATEAIKGFGERVRDAALKSPQLLPTIPIGVKDANGQQQTTSFAALSGLVDSQLRYIEYGSGTSKEVERLQDLLGLPGSGDGGSRDPTKNLQDMRDILSGANNGVLQGDKASELASTFARVFEEKYQGKDKDSIVRDLNQIRETFKTSTDVGERRDALAKLKEIAVKSDSDKGLTGMGSLHSTVSREIKALNDVTQAPTVGGTAPTGAATGPTSPVTQPGSRTTPPTPTPTSVATLITPTSPLGTGITGLTGGVAGLPVPASTAITTLDANVATARTALGTLQTTPNATNLTDARTAVTAALTQARAVQSDTAIAADATLLGHANTTVTQLEEVDRQLGTLTI